ncbi:MAG: ATP-binding cassette domain-containing protein [Eubacteriales bacterium]|nr:ATP-binding cassette domain-containing protein [Eubacteriales bacterium]
MIELEHVSKTFGAGCESVEAVSDVSLSIGAGEIFGIIGFSGAGKSTLVRCINMLETPTEGKVTVDGKELTALRPGELRKARSNIGMIFQHFNLMRSRTVYGNIAFPLLDAGLTKEQEREKVRGLLKLVDMEDKENAYPSQLSGGQKQRVAIARALASDPKVLLCDEATSALDPQTTQSILRLLRDLNRELGLTIVIITHEMAVVKEVCHRVAVMENGRVVELGGVFDIFAHPEQPITQDFIRTTSNLQKVYDLLEEKSPVVQLQQDERIVRLTYDSRNVAEPVISVLSREYRVNMSIIFSSIEIIEDAPLGGLVAIMGGEDERIEQALNYLKERNVSVEVIADGRAAE